MCQLCAPLGNGLALGEGMGVPLTSAVALGLGRGVCVGDVVDNVQPATSTPVRAIEEASRGRARSLPSRPSCPNDAMVVPSVRPSSAASRYIRTAYIRTSAPRLRSGRGEGHRALARPTSPRQDQGQDQGQDHNRDHRGEQGVMTDPVPESLHCAPPVWRGRPEPSRPSSAELKTTCVPRRRSTIRSQPSGPRPRIRAGARGGTGRWGLGAARSEAGSGIPPPVGVPPFVGAG
jgi:hypothetical protein